MSFHGRFRLYYICMSLFALLNYARILSWSLHHVPASHSLSFSNSLCLLNDERVVVHYQGGTVISAVISEWHNPLCFSYICLNPSEGDVILGHGHSRLPKGSNRNCFDGTALGGILFLLCLLCYMYILWQCCLMTISEFPKHVSLWNFHWTLDDKNKTSPCKLPYNIS